MILFVISVAKFNACIINDSCANKKILSSNTMGALGYCSKRYVNGNREWWIWNDFVAYIKAACIGCMQSSLEEEIWRCGICIKNQKLNKNGIRSNHIIFDRKWL